MLITTNIDVSQGLALCDLILKKLPYATNNALTRTAKELVEVEKAELKTEFQVRKQFVLNLVKITKYSKPGDLWTRVAIDTSRTQGGQVLLTMFEDGGEKEPQFGDELAIPITGGAARPAFSAPVTPSLLYKKLNMQKHVTSGVLADGVSYGAVQYKGDRRTFVIPGVGVFQRTNERQRKTRRKRGINPGRGTDENIVLLYRFKPEVHLKQQMHFEKTARELVLKRFSEIWNEEFVRELAGRARK